MHVIDCCFEFDDNCFGSTLQLELLLHHHVCVMCWSLLQDLVVPVVGGVPPPQTGHLLFEWYVVIISVNRVINHVQEFIELMDIIIRLCMACRLWFISK